MNERIQDIMDWSEVSKKFQEATAEHEKYFNELVEKCDPDTKLAVTAWVMKHIVEHAQDGGSYRYLIYQRLGFGPEAYGPLCDNGMTISNEFDLNQIDAIIAAYREGNEIKLKAALGVCDEPGCFNKIRCVWPTKDGGYRSTCGIHYDGKMKDKNE